MVEPLTHWITVTDKGYDIASCSLKLDRKWYNDDGILVNNTIEDMTSLLDIVQQFSAWSGIHLNVAKCKSPLTSTQYNPSPKGGIGTTHSEPNLLTALSQAAPSAPLPRTSLSRADT